MSKHTDLPWEFGGVDGRYYSYEKQQEIKRKKEAETKARRAALLEEVVEALKGKIVNPWSYHNASWCHENNAKYRNLIARVRAEWGEG